MSDQTKDGGGPAFPQFAKNPWGDTYTCSQGMTLRDYFAAKALGALFSIEANPRIGTQVQPYEWSEEARTAYANEAYRLADAMIAARR